MSELALVEAERDRYKDAMMRAARLVNEVVTKDPLDMAQAMALGGAVEVIGIALGWPIDGPVIDTSALDEHASAEQEERIRLMQTTIAFFASAIKSGEPWSDSCETALRHALGPKP